MRLKSARLAVYVAFAAASVAVVGHVDGDRDRAVADRAALAEQVRDLGAVPIVDTPVLQPFGQVMLAGLNGVSTPDPCPMTP